MLLLLLLPVSLPCACPCCSGVARLAQAVAVLLTMAKRARRELVTDDYEACAVCEFFMCVCRSGRDGRAEAEWGQRATRRQLVAQCEALSADLVRAAETLGSAGGS